MPLEQDILEGLFTEKQLGTTMRNFLTYNNCIHIQNGQEWCDYYIDLGRCGNSCPHYENKFLEKAA
jgi:hypothetical protein|tara:strand:- start:46 stop:243 length:198 start_codon:yes stop_codon:yes gene_type:complete